MKSKHRQKRITIKYKKSKSKKIKYGGSNSPPLTNNNNNNNYNTLTSYIDDRIEEIWLKFADIEERIEALEK